MKDISIALDLGASTTKMCTSELGFILNEPSFACEDNNQLLFGFEAKQKQGEFLPCIQLFNNGKVLNTNIFTKYIKYMLKKANIQGLIKYVYVTIPNAIEISELNKIEKCLVDCGAIKVKFLNQTQLAYKTLNATNYRMIVDIGASKTDISIIKNGDVFAGLNLSFGCDDIDEKIKEYCYNTFSIDITKNMAETIRENVASLSQNTNLSYSFYGLSINGNKFAKNTIQSLDIAPIVNSVYADICSAIETLLNSYESVVEDIIENGIDLIGGGALIIGLSQYINIKLNVKANIKDNSSTAVALALEKLV